MKETRDKASKVSTCFEGSPCAEMMRKITSEHGIGSLCEEMMGSLLEVCDEDTEAPPAAKNDKGHGSEEKSNKTEV